MLLCYGVVAVVHRLVEIGMGVSCVVHKPSDLYIDDTTEPLGWQYATMPIFITFMELSLCVGYLDTDSFFMHLLCMY